MLHKLKWKKKKHFYDPLRSSMLYACAFILYLLDLPFKGGLFEPYLIIVPGLCATLFFVIDFVKLYKANDCEKH